MHKDIRINELEITLPQYMNVASQSAIDVASKCSTASNKIIACGIHPIDKKITLLTAIGETFIFDPDEMFVPHGEYVPTTDFEEVMLLSELSCEIHSLKVRSSWLIAKSQSAIKNAHLQIGPNYICEINLD
jgi:hypothetical protein